MSRTGLPGWGFVQSAPAENASTCSPVTERNQSASSSLLPVRHILTHRQMAQRLDGETRAPQVASPLLACRTSRVEPIPRTYRDETVSHDVHRQETRRRTVPVRLPSAPLPRSSVLQDFQKTGRRALSTRAGFRAPIRACRRAPGAEKPDRAAKRKKISEVRIGAGSKDERCRRTCTPHPISEEGEAKSDDVRKQLETLPNPLLRLGQQPDHTPVRSPRPSLRLQPQQPRMQQQEDIEQSRIDANDQERVVLQRVRWGEIRIAVGDRTLETL